jgi:hypothetical protein
MNGADLTSLPREMMRSMAGFPTNGRSFYLACGALDLPTSLCKKLFPAIDKCHDRLAADKLSPDNNDPIRPTVAANAFVQVIMMLMMELRPCHPFDNIQSSLIQPTCHLKDKSASKQ